MRDLYCIEDDRNIASAVREYPKRSGFRVTVCVPPAEARQVLTEHVPSCLKTVRSVGCRMDDTMM